MAIWNRIIQALTGQTESATSDVGECLIEPPSTSESAVAVLDNPRSTESGQSPDDSTAPWFTPEDAELLEPCEPPRPEMTLEARVLENLLLIQFDGYDVSLPPLPRVPDLVLKTLRNPECSFNAVADIISGDQVAAATVLRTANSPIYGGRNRITSLPQAVARLGTNALKTLMMHQSLRAAMFLAGHGDQELAGVFWRRSLACAFTMRGLAELTGMDPEDALVAGLLHDVGNVIVLRIVSEEQAAGHYLPDHDTIEYLCHETHQEFGELVATEWNMPASLKELIQNHHKYPQPDDPLRTARLILILTDMIVRMLGFTAYIPYNLPKSRPAQDLKLADRPDFIRFLQQLPDQIENSMEWF